jgi:hypothetical protein
VKEIESVIGEFWGAHAPSRAGFGAPAETDFRFSFFEGPVSRSNEKVREGETPSPARKTRALPKSTCSRPNF